MKTITQYMPKNIITDKTGHGFCFFNSSRKKGGALKKKIGEKLKKNGLHGLSMSPHTRVTSNKSHNHMPPWEKVRFRSDLCLIELISVNEQFEADLQQIASDAL